MKIRHLLSLVVLLCATGCASVSQQPDSPSRVLTILSAAQWGVEASHDELYLNDADYQLFTDTNGAIRAAVQHQPSKAIDLAKAALTDLQKRLPPDSRLGPYITAASVIWGD